tara:strand:- start:1303 stop:1509 length:207 start_codon:yes stop_codon:yes gene_type:complete
MNDEQFMYVLEAMAYISATIAAFVYIWETCSPRKYKSFKNKSSSNSSLHEEKLIPNNRRSSSSLYEGF